MALMHMHTNTGFHVKLIYNGGPGEVSNWIEVWTDQHTLGERLCSGNMLSYAYYLYLSMRIPLYKNTHEM